MLADTRGILTQYSADAHIALNRYSYRARRHSHCTHMMLADTRGILTQYSADAHIVLCRYSYRARRHSRCTHMILADTRGILTQYSTYAHTIPNLYSCNTQSVLTPALGQQQYRCLGFNQTDVGSRFVWWRCHRGGGCNRGNRISGSSIPTLPLGTYLRFPLLRLCCLQGATAVNPIINPTATFPGAGDCCNRGEPPLSSWPSCPTITMLFKVHKNRSHTYIHQFVRPRHHALHGSPTHSHISLPFVKRPVLSRIDNNGILYVVRRWARWV